MSDKEILKEIDRLKNYKKSEWTIEEMLQVDNAITHLQEMLIENRINRAIEFIESYHNTALWECDKKKLLNILRGEENEPKKSN